MAGKAVYNEGRAVSYVWNEELFEEGLATVNYLLSIESLHEEQKTALRMYFKDGVDLYYSAPTGHGKSLVFQAIPVISDVLAGLAPLSSNILVITPLVSLMQDQVERIKKNTSVTAAAIFQGQEESVLKDIEAGGVYSIIYASPESLLSDNTRWRKLLSSSGLSDYCVGVAVDEAHCIHQW